MRVWVCVQPLACNRKCLCMCELMQLHARMHFSRACVCFCLKLLVLFVEWSTGAHSDRWCKLLIAVFPVAECGGPCPPSLSLFFLLLLLILFVSLLTRSFFESGLSHKHQAHFSHPSHSPLSPFIPVLFPSFIQFAPVYICIHQHGPKPNLFKVEFFFKFRMDQRWKNFFNRLNPLTH